MVNEIIIRPSYQYPPLDECWVWQTNNGLLPVKFRASLLVLLVYSLANYDCRSTLKECRML